MPRRGRLIVFEGADGIGKTTQAKLLADRLTAAGFRTAWFSFPRYGSVVGDVLKDLLHRGESIWRSLDWRARGLLFAADRLAALPELERARRRCAYVILDRYVESNAAYLLSEARNIVDARRRAQWVFDLEYVSLGLPRPDVTVVLTLSPRLALRLIRNERPRDVNETLQYQRRLQRAYRLSAQPGMPRVQISVGAPSGTIRPIEDVHARVVLELVRARALPSKVARGLR